MATNIQLELALKAAQKDIEELRSEIEKLKSVSAATVAADLALLRKVLDAAFRNAGLSNDWWSANAVNHPTVSEALSQTYETKAPQPPQSVVHSFSELQDISQEPFGTRDLAMTPERIEQLKQQFGGKE
jgi:hypothetical protein